MPERDTLAPIERGLLYGLALSIIGWLLLSAAMLAWSEVCG